MNRNRTINPAGAGYRNRDDLSARVTFEAWIVGNAELNRPCLRSLNCLARREFRGVSEGVRGCGGDHLTGGERSWIESERRVPSRVGRRCCRRPDVGPALAVATAIATGVCIKIDKVNATAVRRSI